MSIQDQTKTHEDIICGQPQTYPSSIFEGSTNVPTTCQILHNPSFNVSPPSFNLKTNQKSTPIRPTRNCNSACSETAIETRIDVDNPSNETDMQSDQTFYSLR